MLNVIYKHGVLALCVLIVAGTAAATYVEIAGDHPAKPQAQSATFRLNEPPLSGRDRELLSDSYRWDAGLQQFNAFATPEWNEYGRTKGSIQDAGAPAIVPEPGSMVLLAGGLAALAVRRMRRRIA